MYKSAKGWNLLGLEPKSLSRTDERVLVMAGRSLGCMCFCFNPASSAPRSLRWTPQGLWEDCEVRAGAVPRTAWIVSQRLRHVYLWVEYQRATRRPKLSYKYLHRQTFCLSQQWSPPKVFPSRAHCRYGKRLWKCNTVGLSVACAHVKSEQK